MIAQFAEKNGSQGKAFRIMVRGLSYIRGSSIDYVDSFTGAGFTIKNPNAKSSCGCGQSFKA